MTQPSGGQQVGAGYVSVSAVIDRAAVTRSATEAGRGFADQFTRSTRSSINPDDIFGGANRGARREGGRAGDQYGNAAADSAGSSFTDKFVVGITAAAAVGAAALSAGFAGAMDMSSANDKLRSQLGISEAESKKYGKTAGALYASNYGESMTEVTDVIAQAIREVPSLKGDELGLKEVTSGALDMARVFDVDAGQAVRGVGQLIKTGMVKDSKEGMDVITRMFQAIPGAGEDALDTLNEYSGQFQKVGFDATTAGGFIKQLMDGGAKSTDLAADALKEFSIRSIDGSKATVDGYKAIGMNADAAAQAIAKGGPSAKATFGEITSKINAIQDPVKRNAAGVAFFGTQWEDLGGAIKNVNMKTAADGLGQVAGAAQSLKSNSPADTLATVGRTIQTKLVTVLGGVLIPLLTDLWKNIGPGITAVFSGLGAAVGVVGGWLKKYSGWLIPVAAGFTAIAGAVGLYTAAISIWSGVTKAAAAVQVAFNAVISANPIGLIVLALVGLGVALVVAYKKSETFRNIVNGAWNGIKVGLSAAWNFIKGVFNAWTTYLKALWNTAISAKNLIVSAFNLIRQGVSIWWAGVKANFKMFTDALAFLWSKVIVAKNTVVNTFNILRNGISGAINGIKGYLNGLWGSVNDIFNKIKGKLVNFKDSAVAAFRNAASGIASVWNRIKAIAATPVNFLINSVYNGGIKKLWDGLAGKVGLPNLPSVSPLKFARGGVAPGSGSRDTVPAMLTPGEGILTKGEMKKLGGPAGFAQLRQQIQYFKDGGIVGWIKDKIGTPIRGMLSEGANQMASTFIRPAINRIPGSGMWADASKGVANTGLNKMLSWIKGDDKKNGFGGPAGSGKIMGWSNMMKLLQSKFSGMSLYSGFRNSRTLSGNKSLHASGRAIDTTPRRDVAQWIIANFGKNIKELISPWTELNWHNGRPHKYSAAVERQHGAYGAGNDHIHWAMDNGGPWTPGTTAVNTSGKPELALNNAQAKALEDRIRGTDGDTYVIEMTVNAASIKEIQDIVDMVKSATQTSSSRNGRLVRA